MIRYICDKCEVPIQKPMSVRVSFGTVYAAQFDCYTSTFNLCTDCRTELKELLEKWWRGHVHTG